MNFDQLPKFQKEFKRLSKKYKSLLKDIEQFKGIVSVVPQGNKKHFNINRSTPINIVTSALHSKRTAMCFKKNGFTNFHVIIHHTSGRKDPDIARNLMTSRFEGFRPSDKKYNDIFMKLRNRTNYFFNALREMAAIFLYKIKGFA